MVVEDDATHDLRIGLETRHPFTWNSRGFDFFIFRELRDGNWLRLSGMSRSRDFVVSHGAKLSVDANDACVGREGKPDLSNAAPWVFK